MLAITIGSISREVGAGTYLVDLLDGVSIGRNLSFYADYDVSSDWALTHICELDKSLGVFLNSKGVY